MAFETCSEPQLRDLAVHDIRTRTADYEAQFREHLDFWTDVGDQAELIEDPEKAAIAATLSRELGTAIRTGIDPVYFDLWHFDSDEHPHYDAWDPDTWVGQAPNPFVVEHLRRRAMATLGVSHLMRRLFQPEDASTDPNTFSDSSVILDEALAPNQLPAGVTVHVSPEAADVMVPRGGADDAWYKMGDLFVRRSTPARISRPMMAFLIENGAPSFVADGLVSLEPQMAAIRH